ncbi:hypothetical protein glysoja_044777 [Glycine soja]|uniref:DUF7271 domain-containing protein n=1 Tax=Glycine soja TaxID=3848 RepID=A0A0B2PZK9_GLYSO|nr:hypothetical protein glysoja_044777 [Glycine soja]
MLQTMGSYLPTDFRRALGIHEGLVVHFAAPDRNTSFYLHFMPPLDRQTSGRPYSTTRTYVFTINITNRIISTPTPLDLNILLLNHPVVIRFRGCLSKMVYKLSLHLSTNSRDTTT